MRITVSGLPGSGTTSLSRYLSERHGFSMISAGEVFRQLAREHAMGLAEFGHLAQENPEFDKMIDARQKEIAAGQDDIIVEGRLSGWMVTDADLRIWLFAPLTCRVKRLVFRDQIADDKTAERITLEREACEAAGTGLIIILISTIFRSIRSSLTPSTGELKDSAQSSTQQ